jgi:hypothetical protein
VVLAGKHAKIFFFVTARLKKSVRIFFLTLSLRTKTVFNDWKNILVAFVKFPVIEAGVGRRTSR